MDKDQLIFYALDPLKGQGAEITRTKVGDPGIWMNWALSQDGKSIAVTGCDELHHKVRIIDLQTGAQHELPIPSFILGGMAWSSDGRAIFGAAQGKPGFNILRLDLSGKSQIFLSLPAGRYIFAPIVSPDDRFLAYSQQSQTSNAYLLENF